MKEEEGRKKAERQAKAEASAKAHSGGAASTLLLEKIHCAHHHLAHYLPPIMSAATEPRPSGPPDEVTCGDLVVGLQVE